MSIIKDLGNGRKAFFGAGLFESLKDGCLKAGDLIDVVAGTVQLIVDPFLYPTKRVVTAVTNSGSKDMPMQVIKYHLKDKRITGKGCILGSKEDEYYSNLYWRALS